MNLDSHWFTPLVHSIGSPWDSLPAVFVGLVSCECRCGTGIAVTRAWPKMAQLGTNSSRLVEFGSWEATSAALVGWKDGDLCRFMQIFVLFCSFFCGKRREYREKTWENKHYEYKSYLDGNQQFLQTLKTFRNYQPKVGTVETLITNLCLRFCGLKRWKLSGQNLSVTGAFFQSTILRHGGCILKLRAFSVCDVQSKE